MPKIEFSAATSRSLRDQIIEFAALLQGSAGDNAQLLQDADEEEEYEPSAVTPDGTPEVPKKRGRKPGQTKAALEADKLKAMAHAAASAPPPAAPTATLAPRSIVVCCTMHALTLDPGKYLPQIVEPKDCPYCEAAAKGPAASAAAHKANGGGMSMKEVLSVANDVINGRGTKALQEILQQFGVECITPKPGKTALPPEQYEVFAKACLTPEPPPASVADAAAETLL